MGEYEIEEAPLDAPEIELVEQSAELAFAPVIRYIHPPAQD